jgi:hypothetical protein
MSASDCKQATSSRCSQADARALRDASGRWRATLLKAVLGMLLPLGMQSVHAQVGVSEGGSPGYSQAIAVPAGVAGMSPKLGLSYAGGGINGPVGHGWSVQGISSITRCPASKAIDGQKAPVTYSASDKLCLDGQRLIQTDAAGTVLAFPQTNDALGLSSGYREFRTEKDTYARVRAYGYASGDTSGASGPAYFKVWTKSGQVYEYGASPSADGNTKALISPYNKTVAIAWAVARIADTLGNFIDFKYEQRDVAWGSGPTAGSPTLGHEWNIAEIQYSGNKVIFSYADRVATTPQDAAEAYHQGSKNVSMRLLKSITTYVNSPNPGSLGAAQGAVPVKTVKLGYDNGPISGRSRVTSIQECAGDALSTRCLPGNSFTYAPGGNDAYQSVPAFNLSGLGMQALDGTYGVLTGDFNGDGKTDIIRWSNTPAQNQLYFSNGNGTFTLASQFNITDKNLFRSDGCYYAMLADIDGDGLVDILRYSAATNLDGAGCTFSDGQADAGQVIIYKNNGDGSFTQLPFSGPTLQRGISKPIAKPRLPEEAHAGWSSGANFFFIDVDGDGKFDIVTTILPFYSTIADPTVDPCTTQVCTRVWRSNGDGSFTEKSTNIANTSIYVKPSSASGLGAPRNVADVDGDGFADLVGISVQYFNKWAGFKSNGDGTFAARNYLGSCDLPLDFNGDGRADCLLPAYNGQATGNAMSVAVGGGAYTGVASFNLKTAGQELNSVPNQPVTVGSVVADVNGDGRQDILRWKDDPAANVVYLSNGDGTFTQSSTFKFDGATTQLKKSDGTSDFIFGDFTGKGALEILVLNTTANKLYVKADATPADQLISATSGSGVKTTLYYVPLSNSTPSNGGVSGNYGPRYISDRGTANAASGNKMDLTFPLYVVATSVTDSGVSNQTVATEYSYLGLKADMNGRGVLGFRESRHQSPGPNGGNISVFTTYLQDQPYIGVASRTETRYGTLDTPTAQLLSRTINIYCDQTVPGAENTATETAPCPTSAKVQRPYLRQSTETGFDLNGATLPQVVTTNTYSGGGDPMTIVVTTTGSVAGINQTFTKGTTNNYYPDDTSCSADATCNWILGRLSRASVQSTVPNSLASIATSAGTSPNASATAGNGPTQFASITPNLPFGSVNVGSSSTLTATLTNTGATTLTMTVPTAASVTGTDFSFVSTDCTTSLSPSASCTIVVQFTPSANAARPGTLSISTGAGSLTSSLSGTGTGGAAKLTFSYPGGTSVVWGTQQIGGTYGSATATLTNTGNITATSVSVATSVPWSLANNTCGTTLNVNASCTFSINFSPTAAQAYASSVTASTTSGTAMNSLALTGTGTAPSLAKISADNFSYNTPANTGSGHFIGVQNNGNGPVTINGLTYSVSSGNFNAWMAGSGSGNPNGNYCWPGVVLQPGWSCGAWANADTGSGTATFNTTAGNITYTGSFTAKSLSYSATTGASAAATSGQTPNVYSLTISNATPFTYYFPRFGSTGSAASIGRFTGGNSGNFVITGTTCGANMAPNTSCTVAIAATGISSIGTTYSSNFQPNGTYQQTGDGNNGTWAGAPNWLMNMGTSITDVYVSATNQVSVTAISPVSFSPASGTQLSASSTQECGMTRQYGDAVVTVANIGSASFTFSSSSNSSSLGLTNSCTTVNPGASCTVTIRRYSTSSGSAVTVTPSVGSVATYPVVGTYQAPPVNCNPK